MPFASVPADTNWSPNTLADRVRALELQFEQLTRRVVVQANTVMINRADIDTLREHLQAQAATLGTVPDVDEELEEKLSLWEAAIKEKIANQPPPPPEPTALDTVLSDEFEEL